MSDIAALLERVRAATGREIALEREIMCSIGGWERLSPSQHPRNHKHPMFVDTLEGYLSHEGRTLHRDVPRVMESIDAALALVERVLPGCGIVVDREPVAKGGVPAGATIWGWIGEEGPEGLAWDDVDATGASFPLAILTALLLALKDQPHD